MNITLRKKGSTYNTVIAPMIALRLLTSGFGMDDEVFYKLVILPFLCEQIQYPYIKTRKLPCKDDATWSPSGTDMDFDSLPVGLEKYGHEIDTLPYMKE